MSVTGRCSLWHVRAARACGVAAVLSICAAAPSRGQLVRGEVAEVLNARPVGSAFVLLIDDAGGERARTMTDALGRFTIRAPDPGRYRLRTLVVGYQRWTSEPFMLGRGETKVDRIELDLVRAALPVFVVEAEQICRKRPGEGPATAALWEEIKNALAATEWAINRRDYRFITMTAERSLDRHLVVSEEMEQTSTAFSYWPFVSLPPEQLAERGFVQDAIGGPVYYGPDARVLVSDAFLDQHCFRVRRKRDQGVSLVGLAFEPVDRRRVPDIEGVLWVDSATVELRLLEYRYTGLPRWAPESRVGGSIEFAQLETGAWFIRRWRLRAPVPQVFPGRRDTLLYGFKEKTGDVVEVMTATGTSLIRFESEAHRPR
jgi:hypothetical protein